MSKMNSQEANKLLNKINSQIKSLEAIESMSSTFIAATIENVEDVRPEYNFWKVRNEITILQEKVRKIKHAINLFNVSTELPGMSITIDQALIFMPQLTSNLYKLEAMKTKLPKERIHSSSGNIIDYKYANYDIKDAEEEYEATSDMLAKLQNAMNIVNSTIEFDIPD